MSGKDTTLTVRLDRATKARLEAEAQAEGRTLSNYVLWILSRPEKARAR